MSKSNAKLGFLYLYIEGSALKKLKNIKVGTFCFFVSRYHETYIELWIALIEIAHYMTYIYDFSIRVVTPVEFQVRAPKHIRNFLVIGYLIAKSDK